MLFIVGNCVRQVRFDSEKLSPQQWDKIADLTGLREKAKAQREKAKAQLEDYIGFYRAMRNDSRQHYGDVAQTIGVFKKREEQTLKDLNNLMSGRELLPAIAMGIEHQVPIFDEELELIRNYLEQTTEQKRKLLDWYDKALTRLHRSKTRVPSSLFNLVRLLNSLLEQHTKQRISSGRNDPAFMYVIEVCKIAEPELLRKNDEGYSAIHEVTKRVVTEINEGESEFAFYIEGWGDLIPCWVEKNNISIDDPRWKIKVKFHEGTDGSFKLHYDLPEIEGEGSLFILRPFFAPKTQD